MYPASARAPYFSATSRMLSAIDTSSGISIAHLHRFTTAAKPASSSYKIRNAIPLLSFARPGMLNTSEQPIYETYFTHPRKPCISVAILSARLPVSAQVFYPRVASRQGLSDLSAFSTTYNHGPENRVFPDSEHPKTAPNPISRMGYKRSRVRIAAPRPSESGVDGLSRFLGQQIH